VLEIVDHHQDEGQYLDTCSGVVRNVAFADDHALVASTCTLVAERLKELWKPPYPASLGVLLLGVILLDSVNLSLEVGKVTQRDRDAVENLLENTNWQDLPHKSRKALDIAALSGPNTAAFFDVLQDAKYEPSFWKALSVRDALRYDYKFYTYEKGMFGISAILMPLTGFLDKTDLIVGILRYMAEVSVDFLGIMFAFEDNGNFRRQLALCGKDDFLLHDMVEFLLNSDYDQDSLDLKALEESLIPQENQGLSLRFFDQCNVKPSRKQIGPIMLHFFECTSNSSSAND